MAPALRLPGRLAASPGSTREGFGPGLGEFLVEQKQSRSSQKACPRLSVLACGAKRQRPEVSRLTLGPGVPISPGRPTGPGGPCGSEKWLFRMPHSVHLRFPGRDRHQKSLLHRVYSNNSGETGLWGSKDQTIPDSASCPFMAPTQHAGCSSRWRLP